MTMPAASTVTTPGTTTLNPATRRLNFPGTSTRTLPLNRPNTSTPMSKVPRMPVKSAVTPLCCCCCEVPAAAEPEPPKARLARFRPTAMVR